MNMLWKKNGSEYASICSIKFLISSSIGHKKFLFHSAAFINQGKRYENARASKSLDLTFK